MSRHNRRRRQLRQRKAERRYPLTPAEILKLMKHGKKKGRWA